MQIRRVTLVAIASGDSEENLLIEGAFPKYNWRRELRRRYAIPTSLVNQRIGRSTNSKFSNWEEHGVYMNHCVRLGEVLLLGIRFSVFTCCVLVIIVLFND
jgi:hypothetical protein